MTDARIEKMRAAFAEGRRAPRNPFVRHRDRDTRKSAIDAFCWQCMGGQPEAAEGARALIRDCAATPESNNPCPLWNWRPYK
jgi:hypothetical protein